MKKYLFLMMATVVAMIFSCTTTDPESCDNFDFGQDFSCPDNVETNASFCSDGINKSYYDYNGNKYFCDGVEPTTCDSALNKISLILLENGCSQKKSGSLKSMQIRLSEKAEQLLIEVKSEALCE